MALDTPSWVVRRPAVATTAACSRNFLKHDSFFFCKATPTAISGCASHPTESTPSYSRPWYNPLLRRRPLDQHSPEIVRHWIDSDYDSEAGHPLERFTVMSYNILGDKNAFKHKDLYSSVPLEYVKWSYRKRLICREVIGLSPDIICMQEVDRYFDLLNVLEKAGYAGSYKRRTGNNVDGCAMFWKADKFRLLEAVSIEFKEFGLRDNVAQICVFEMCRATSRRIVIGNTHVLYNPKQGEVKLGQISFLSSRAQIISERWGHAPLVLAGDFNSTPQSAIYKFLSSSELDIKLYDKRELSGQRSCHPAHVFGVKKETSNTYSVMDRFFRNFWTDEEVKIATADVKRPVAVHPLNLNSSYASVRGSAETRDVNGEPLATSYHSKFFGTVDYLWYSDSLVPTRVLDTLSVDLLRRTGGLPCKKLGSDHLALVSEFAFAKGVKAQH